MRYLPIPVVFAFSTLLMAAGAPEIRFELSARIGNGEPVMTSISLPSPSITTIPAVGPLQFRIEVKAMEGNRLVSTAQIVSGGVGPPLQRAMIYGWLPDNLVRSGGFTVCGTRVILEIPIPVQPASCEDLPPLAPMLEPLGGCIEYAGAYEGMPVIRSARTRLAPIGEPGEPLVLTGRTLDEDGLPRSGVIVYAFQTDHTGVYPAARPSRSTMSQSQGRLRAWVRTDAQGRYTFDTIRPGGYPDSGEPQHIHMVVIEPGCWATMIEDVHFSDDLRLQTLSGEDRERYLSGIGGSGIVTPVRKGPDAPWRIERDIHLGRNVVGYPGCPVVKRK
jgi:hypothetical protein